MPSAPQTRRGRSAVRAAQWVSRAIVPLMLFANVGCYWLALYLVLHGRPAGDVPDDAWQLVAVSALVGFQAVWLVWLRPQPFGTVVASLLLWQAAVLISDWETLAVQPGLLFALFVFAAERAGLRRWLVVTGGVVVTFATLVAAYALHAPLGAAPWRAPAVLIGWALVAAATVAGPAFAGAWYAGLRARAERIAELALRASSSEAVRTAEAVAAERRTLAQEIHDTSSAHLAALLALSAAAESTAAAGGAAHATLITQIRSEGERLYQGFERMLNSMRQEDRTVTETHQPGVRPGQHSVSELPALVEEHRTVTGADVSVWNVPAWHEIDHRLGPMRAHIAYRVVQEALSNARKHADGAAISITIEDDGSELLLRIENDPPPYPDTASRALRGLSLGYGLEGMRDRLVAAGGSLRTGPRQNGGWSVNALLPHPPHQRRARRRGVAPHDVQRETDEAHAEPSQGGGSIGADSTNAIADTSRPVIAEGAHA
ncbi:sensor histidine kinase [Microbacterium sp. CPCC 204701]|uniref:sensor histidine kinase n=1 Tax=Microbacterium sp. CPCC 204701 TaxID=2493084 RepID=UPI000FD92392|nr:sensor histidine kinase [Microbacterium sp. CPCC 204701]